MGLSVTGGVGGITACLEDLATVTSVLLATATAVTDAAHAAAFGRLEIGGCSGLDLGARNGQLDAILAGLGTATSTVLKLADDLRTLAKLVHYAAESYHDADQGLVHRFASALSSLPGATIRGELTFSLTGNPLKSVQQFLTSDPSVVGLLASATLGAHVPSLGKAWVADGNPVVTDEFTDVAPPAVNAPHSYQDLIGALSERNAGDSGEISVSFVYGAGGRRHAIVDIPGTKSWDPLHTADITSPATNLRAIDGGQTSYEKGVLLAMSQAGVTAQDDVMLVGHSEGGMVAVAAARDSIGKFQVSHVVTAGAPIGRFVGDLPPTVQVLALEDAHDIVPALDAAGNPDRPNIITVVGGRNHGSIGANHNLDDSYLPLAGQVDASDNVSIREFTTSAAGFFDQDYMTTQKFLITREY